MRKLLTVTHSYCNIITIGNACPCEPFYKIITGRKGKRKVLKKKNLVTKSNVLNELRCGNTSLIEYRLFCIYLSRVNPLDETTKVVEFTLSEYANIMDLKQPRKEILESQARNICQKTIKIEDGEGGFSVYSLFSEFKLSQHDNDWYITLECNHKLIPHLFQNREKFFKYKLWNTLYLKSYNQQRIYELLKQYEKIGKREISLADLREYLSIGDKEYPVWGIFDRDVLKVAQKACKEKTDIYFEYETTKVKRKVVGICFYIHKNKEHKDPMALDEFLNPKTKKEPKVHYDGENFAVQGKDFMPVQMSLEEWANNQNEPVKTEKQIELQTVNEQAFKNEFDLDTVERLRLLADEEIKKRTEQLNTPEEKLKKEITYLKPFYLQMNSAEMKQNTKTARANYIAVLIKSDVKRRVEQNETNKQHPKTSFNNIDRRPYDMDALEAQLLNIQ